RYRLPVVALRCLDRFGMALRTIRDGLRIRDLVEQHATVVVAGLCQLLTHMQAVDKRGKIACRLAVDSVGRTGIACRRRRRFRPAVLALVVVAHHAETRVLTIAAVELERPVTFGSPRHWRSRAG